MTLSIRLDPDLERDLALAAERTGRSKSDIVKSCLREHLARLAPRKTPYELGMDLFGSPGVEPGVQERSSPDYVRREIVERVRAENDR